LLVKAQSGGYTAFKISAYEDRRLVNMAKSEVLVKVKELIAAPSCYSELKTIAQEYLAAVGTANEKAAGKELIAELEEDVETIDEVMAFLNSEKAVEILGKETVAAMLEQGKKIKTAGGKYCFCPACVAGKAILDMKDEM